MKAHSNKNLLVNLILAFLASLFLIAVYRVYQKNILLSLEYFFPIAMVFYSLALIFIFSLSWSFENKSRILLTCSAVFFALFMIDSALHFIDLNPRLTLKSYREKTAKKLGQFFDNRFKFEIVNQSHAQGNLIWPNISPEYFVESEGIDFQTQKLFPVGPGIAEVNTIVCNESGQYATYHSDEYGFNNPKGVFKSSQVDVVVVGDSFTHGACVNQGEDIASFLRQRTQVQVLNLGNSGVGPLMELASLAEYAAKLKPKQVFWIYFEGNDLPDLDLEAKSSFLLSYLNDNFSQDLLNRQNEVDAALKHYFEKNNQKFIELYNPPKEALNLKEIIKLQNIRKQLMLNKSKQSAHSSPNGLFKLIITTAQRRVNAWGGEFIFVYLPEYKRFKSKNIAAFDQSRHKPEIIQIVQELKIKTLDLSKNFQEHEDPLSFYPMRIEGHFTPQGYQFVANELAKVIT